MRLHPKLTTLNLGESRAQKCNLQLLLAAAPNLQVLDLSATRWIKGVEAICQIKSLQKLYLSRIAQSVPQVTRLLGCAVHSSLKETLQVLYIDQTSALPYGMLVKVADFPNLKTLSVEGMVAVNTGFIKRLVGGCPLLLQLSVAGCWSFDDECLMVLADAALPLVYVDITACNAVSVLGMQYFIDKLMANPYREPALKLEVFLMKPQWPCFPWSCSYTDATVVQTITSQLSYCLGFNCHTPTSMS